MILLLAILFLSPPNWGQQQKPPDEEQNTPHISSAVPSRLGLQNQQTSPPQKNNTANKTEDGPDIPPWWDAAWATWATWALVIIGGVAAIIAICTLRDIREQTRNARIAAIAARQGARAALLNAQAVIASERPWIMISPPEELFTVEHTTVEKGSAVESTSIACKIPYKNGGKQPAWIFRKAVHFAIVETLPEEPAFDENSLVEDFPELEPIGIGEEKILEVKYLNTPGVHVIVLDAGDEPNSFKGNVPVLYGVIKYRDQLESSKVRETRFGYQIKTGRRLERIRSSAYNCNK